MSAINPIIIHGTSVTQTRESVDISENIDSNYDSDDESEGGLEIPANKEKGKDVTKEPVDDSTSPQDAAVRSTLPPQTLLKSQVSTPTTDELLQFASYTGLFAVNLDLSQKAFLATPNQEVEDLARLRDVITRTQVAGTGLGSNDIFSPDIKIQAFAAPQKIPILTIARALLAGMSLKIEDLPEGVISPVVEQDRFQSLAPLQDLKNQSPLASLPGTPRTSGLSLPNSSDLECFANEISLFEGSRPEWAISPDIPQEEFNPFPTRADQAIESLILPPTPILGNLSTPNVSEASVVLGGNGAFFQPVPGFNDSPLKRDVEQQLFIIGEATETSLDLILPAYGTSSQAVIEGAQLSSFHVPPISISDQPTHTPLETSPKVKPYHDIWAEIAHALGVPAKPSHLLTPKALQHRLVEDTIAALQAGYTKSELDQWSLFRSRIMEWITPGALDHGLDDDMNGPPFIVSLPSFWDSEMTEGWPCESVETYWRNEPEKFRRTMDWVQHAEGSVESGHTLPPAIYDFHHDDEEIIHQSVSEPSFKSEELSEDSEDGGVLIGPMSRPDSKYQMVVDLFHARELRRQGPTFLAMNLNPFRSNRGPGEHARNKALILAERIAQGARQRQED